MPAKLLWSEPMNKKGYNGHINRMMDERPVKINIVNKPRLAGIPSKSWKKHWISSSAE